MSAGHNVTRCRYCLVVERQCRCPGPHGTDWVACDSCAQLIAGGARLIDRSDVVVPVVGKPLFAAGIAAALSAQEEHKPADDLQAVNDELVILLRDGLVQTEGLATAEKPRHGLEAWRRHAKRLLHRLF